MTRLFDRYDAADLARRFEEAGVCASLRPRGFTDVEVAINADGRALPHVELRARKAGRVHLLLDACLRRVTLPLAGAHNGGGPLDLILVHWVREQDPTAAFSPTRPRLLLQRHPGLGVLRRAFRVAVGLAGELGADGVACLPKFFHDAVIFHRSRLFLFLDGGEQGRFEALARDLETLPLGEASLAVAGWCVRDAADAVVRWQPGYQVFPISSRLTAHFHSPEYAAAVACGRRARRCHVDTVALAAARAQLGAAEALDEQPSPA